jgi:quinol monooxygenase YgiN
LADGKISRSRRQGTDGRARKEALMAVARVYRMTARETLGDALALALHVLKKQLRANTDCSEVYWFRDLENRHRFLFIEIWDSIEAHKASNGKIGGDVLAHIAAACIEMPEGSYEEVLH